MEKESRYLLEEQELTLGEAPHWAQRFVNIFPAFQHANYRLFFAGQFTSLIGTWIQLVALGWLVLEITDSAFWVSFVNGLETLPIILFSLPAGILADRFEKRKIIIITHVLSMSFAFIFAILIHVNAISLVLIILLTFLLGAAHAVEMPTRNALVFDVVGKRDIGSAIAMNVGMFNSARVIGPALAGILVSVFNTQIAFFINGLSFLAVILALLKLRLKPIFSSKEHSHPFTQLKEGIVFSIKNPVISTLLLVVAFNSLIPWSYSSIMPVIARQIFGRGSEGFGLLLSAAGAGALIGAIFVSSSANRLRIGKIIAVSGGIIGVALIVFSFTTSFYLALLVLLVIGFNLVTQVSLANATIQRAAPDYIRGRVISVYSFMFLGVMPFGNILLGTLASSVGVQLALRVFGIITLIGILFYMLFLENRLEAN